MKLPPAPPPSPRFAPPVSSVPSPAPAKDWYELLKGSKLPTACVVLDFETYFDDDLSLRKMSTVEYIMDERFEVLCLAKLEMKQRFLDPAHQATCWHGEDDVLMILQYLQREFGDDLAGCTVVMQNAKFDSAILAYRYGIYPKHIIDTLGLARAWNSRQKNDVGSLAKRLDLEESKGETAEFKHYTNRVRLYVPKGRGLKQPQQRPRMDDAMRAKLGEYAMSDVRLEWSIFTAMLPRLSNVDAELALIQHTIELFTKPCIAVDYDKADELTAAMNLKMVEAVARTGHTVEDISGTLSFEKIMGDALHAAGDQIDQYLKPAKTTSGTKLAIAKDDPERETLEKHPDETVRLLMSAKAALSSWPGHIKRVGRIAAQAEAAGGLLPVPLKYHGAHTGRWSGDEKINLQNLGERSPEELIRAIRELLIAPPGFTFAIADLSAIEARVLAWLADQNDLVVAFREGQEIYCRFAEKVLDLPHGSLRKPRPDGIPAIEKRMKWARNAIGKVGVLGAGYGMGAAKAEAYAGGEIDFETAQKIITVYRSENTAIVRFWRDIESAFIYTAKYRRPSELAHGLRFESREDADVVMVLPSGREIKYVDVKIEDGQYGPSIRVFNRMKHSWDHVWGGHLTENAVQAIARDLLASALLRLERDGKHVCHHVHDELILMAPEDQGEAHLNAAIAALRFVPAWAVGVPLDAEGVVKKRYGGH